MLSDHQGVAFDLSHQTIMVPLLCHVALVELRCAKSTLHQDYRSTILFVQVSINSNHDREQDVGKYPNLEEEEEEKIEKVSKAQSSIATF